MTRRASTAPVAERNATVTAARLVAVPPSQPENRYRVPVATGGPAACRSETAWVSRAVPPAPPANRLPPGTAGHGPAGGRPRPARPASGGPPPRGPRPRPPGAGPPPPPPPPPRPARGVFV